MRQAFFLKIWHRSPVVGGEQPPPFPRATLYAPSQLRFAPMADGPTWRVYIAILRNAVYPLCAICRLSARPRHTASARCVRLRHMGTQTSCVSKIVPASMHILVPRLNHTVAECVPDGLGGSRLHAFFIPPRGTISRRVSPWETVATEGREELKSDWDYHGFADSNAPTLCAIPISAYAHGGHHDLVLVAEYAPQVASRMVCKHH